MWDVPLSRFHAKRDQAVPRYIFSPIAQYLCSNIGLPGASVLSAAVFGLRKQANVSDRADLPLQLGHVCSFVIAGEVALGHAYNRLIAHHQRNRWLQATR